MKIVPNANKILPPLVEVLDCNDRNQVEKPYMGLSASNPFLGGNAGSRLAMEGKQKIKSIAIDNPEPLPVITGLEYELGEYSKNLTIPARSVVVSIDARESHTNVLYRHDGKIHLLRVTEHGSLDNTFGWQYHTTEAFRELKDGDLIVDDTVLARGSSSKHDEHSMSININVANLSNIECSKDAILISESTRARLSYSTYKTVKFGLRKNDILYNMYGTYDYYKPLPEVGDTVNKMGFIVGYFSKEDNYQLSKANLINYDNMINNGCVFEHNSTIETSKIKSVKVRKLTNSIKEDFFNAPLFSRYKEYLLEIDHFKNIIADDVTEIDDELYAELVQSRATNTTTDDWMVEIVVETTRLPTIKDKIVTRHGSKGLISAIIPDDEMPYDSRGKRAGIIIDSTSIQRRMIMGNKYEGYIFDNAIWQQEKFKATLDAGGDPRADILEYLECYGDQTLIDIIKEATDEELTELINDKGVRPLMNIYEGGFTPYAIIRKIMRSRFATPLDGMWIPNKHGEDVWVQQAIAMEVNAISLHYKNGETFQATATTYVNPLGGVVSPAKEVKREKSINVSPLRGFSESEISNFISYGEAVAKFITRVRIHSSSIEAQSRLVRTIIRSDDPTVITREQEAKIFKGTHDTPVAMLSGLYSAFGVTINRNTASYPKRPENTLA